MADEPQGPGPMGDLFFILGLIVVLAVVWIAQGAKFAQLGGVFIHPPEPVGNGGSYGPQLGTTTTLEVNY